MRNAVIVLTKAPSKGVKTRIAGELGPERARDAYKTFLRMVSDIIEGHMSYVFVEPKEGIPEVRKLIRADYFKAQEGGDLGERMKHAINEVLRQGFDSVVLIGGDAPTMPKDFITKGLNALKTHELVFGPATDGGFYLIGAKDLLPDDLFDGVEWGCDTVLSSVLDNLQGVSYALLPEWADIDTAKQLRDSGL